jgi:helicase
MSLSEIAKLTKIQRSRLEEWGIESLTHIQELAIEADVARGQSAIVCAPTSSGKTLVGELALVNAFSNEFDALYLVSHKALAEQKYRDFINRFPTVTVGISTGDHEEGDVNSRLLVSTYEKALGLILSGNLRLPRRSSSRMSYRLSVIRLAGHQ